MHLNVLVVSDSLRKSFYLNNVTTGYRSKSKVSFSSKALNASLYGGQLTCLLGTNGVGKSTLIRTLAGFQKPLDGSISLFGKPLDDFSPTELSHHLGVVLTDKVPAGGLTAFELVSMGRIPYTGFWGNLSSHDRKIVSDSIRKVGMQGFEQRRLCNLSDGERQKLMIAKALAQQTDVILLDEPIAFLDFPSKIELLQLLRSLAHESGKSILLSTHDLDLALQAADCLWLLLNNGSLLQGTPHDLAKNGALDFFFSPLGIKFNRDNLQYLFSQNNA